MRYPKLCEEENEFTRLYFIQMAQKMVLMSLMHELNSGRRYMIKQNPKCVCSC